MKNIDELVLADLGASFKGDDVRNFLRPCVYCFINKEEVLYVGMGRKGVMRPFTFHHKQASKAREICTELRIWFCVSEEDARELETLLIGKFSPRFNSHGTFKFCWERVQERLGRGGSRNGDAMKAARSRGVRDFEDLSRINSTAFELSKP